MRSFIVLVLVFCGTIGLSACSLLPASNGPELTLVPRAQQWQFDQPLSRQAWRDIKETLTPLLPQLRVQQITLSASTEYQQRAQDIYHWLVKQGVARDHIKMTGQQRQGTTVKLVHYQVQGERCRSPQIWSRMGDGAGHAGPCEVTMLRWKSMTYPEHMIDAGE